MIKETHQMIMPACQTHRRGFNLIELALTMGVVGVIMGGIWLGYDAVKQNLQATQTAKGILNLCQHASKNFPRNLAPVGNVRPTITSAFIATGFKSEGWIVGPTQITHPFGGQIEAQWFGQDFIPSGYANHITFYIYNIPISQCQRIASNVSSNAQSTTFFSSETVGVGQWTGSLGQWTVGPLPIANGAGCNNVNLAGYSRVTFEYICKTY